MPHLDFKGKWCPTPDFRTGFEREQYFEREAERWVNGFRNEIGEMVMTGRMYFYLTLGSLKHGKGNVFRPRWRDGDFLVFNTYENTLKKNKNLLIIKRREFGLTSIFGGSIPIYNSIVHRGSINVITSASEDRLKDIRVNKIYPYKETLMRMGLLPFDHFDNAKGMRFASKQDKSNTSSIIEFIETNKDDRAATNLESRRAFYIFLDEYFIHNRAELVLLSADASMREGENQIGTMVMGGSCSNINKQSAPRLRKLLGQLDAYNLDVLFIPATYNYLPYEDENGFSLHDKAREALEKNRNELRAQHAWDKLTNVIKSYPITEKDLTSSEDANVYSGDVAAVLEKSREICQTMEENNYRCRLINTNRGIFPDADPNGNYFIFEHPKPGHEYIAGMDPIPFKIGAAKEGSQMVCVIKDITTNQYVAYLSMRTSDPEYGFEEFEKLLIYYKSIKYPKAAPCSVETNRGEVIMHMAIIKGKSYLLATLPGKKTPGYTKTGKEGEILHSCMINYLRRCGTICIPKFLDDMNNYPIGDSHIIDAIQGCELYDSYRNGVKPNEKREKELVQRIIRDGAGRTTVVWDEI